MKTMKKILSICAAMLCFINVSFSQEDEGYKKAKNEFLRANELKQQFKISEAAELYQSAANYFKTNRNYSGNYILCRYSIAEIYIQQNRFEEAAIIIDEIETFSIDTYGESNQFLRYIYNGKALILSAEVKLDEAVDYFTKAININSALENTDQSLQSNLYGSLGNVYTEKGDDNKALEYYLKDIELKKSLVGKDNPLLAVGYNNIATVYKSKGEYDLALEHIERGLELNLNEYGKNHPVTALNYFNKANIYADKGQYKIALELYNIAYDIYKNIYTERHKSVANVLNQIGIIYNKLDDYDKALIAHKDAYDIQIEVLGDDHPDLALTSNNIGNILRYQKKYESSLKYYQKAIDIKSKYFGTNHPDIAAYYNNIGITYFELGNYNSAKMFYLRAADIYKNKFGTKNLRLVKIFANLGDIYSKERDYFSSLYYYQRSISANVKDFNPDSTEFFAHPMIKNYYDINNLLLSLQGKAVALENLYAENEENEHYLTYAFETYLRCDTVIAIARSTVEREADKIKLGNTSKKTYNSAVFVSVVLAQNKKSEKKKRYYHEAALYFAENNKSVVLSEAVTASDAKYFAELPDSLLQFEKELKTAIVNYETRLSETYDEEEISFLEFELLRKNDELRKFNNKIEAEYPKYHELKYKSLSFTVEKLQNSLDQNSAVRSYFLGEEFIYVFTVSKDSVQVDFSKKPENFEQKIIDFNKQITTGYESAFKEYVLIAHELYETLFPKKTNETLDHLIIIPDGYIGLIPFESLLTEAYTGTITDFQSFPFLIKQYRIHYAYSAGLYLKSTEQKFSEIKKTWFGIAPVFQTNNKVINGVKLSELPGSEEEVNRISELLLQKEYHVQTILHDNATETTLKNKNLKQYGYIHIATHGHVNTSNPKLSGIFMAYESGQNDGVLYAGEIYNLEMQAHLVILSACETGFGKIEKSEGIIGLGRSLLYSGADNIMVSLWKVSDESTSRLMIDFYKELLENENNNALALHKAKLRMINKGGNFAHPYFWSPFILIGK
jgi:CHAT domain-containing protein